MYLCVRGIYIYSVYVFSIGFWNCSDSVHFITKNWRIAEISWLWENLLSLFENAWSIYLLLSRTHLVFTSFSIIIHVPSELFLNFKHDFVGSVFLDVLMFCVVFCLSFVCVLWAQRSQFLWIVHSWLPLLFSLTFI